MMTKPLENQNQKHVSNNKGPVHNKFTESFSQQLGVQAIEQRGEA
jgi:hypothetical protein